jgi:hypothetical protein
MSEYMLINSMPLRRRTLELLLPHLEAAVLQAHLEKESFEIHTELANVRNTVSCLLINSAPDAAPAQEEDWLKL